MKFHWPSFLIGYGAGVATGLLGTRLRPMLVEVATAAYELGDAVMARFAVAREDVDDVLAEARMKARAKTARRPRARRRAAAS